MNIRIKALSPDLLNDYLSFFDNMTFSENPHWAKCYCYSFHFIGSDELWTRENNRVAVSQLIKEDKIRGFLAYDGDKVIGWCNANDRNNYQGLANIYELEQSKDKRICSIVCFLIHPDYRRKGISSLLMETAIQNCKDAEYDMIEGYPEKESSSCERNYKGPLKLYERNGFKVVRDHEKNYTVRKTLN